MSYTSASELVDQRASVADPLERMGFHMTHLKSGKYWFCMGEQ